MMALRRKAITALSSNPAKLPRAGVNTSAMGNMMRMRIMVSDATVVMMSPNFRLITSLLMGIHVLFYCSVIMTCAANLTVTLLWAVDKYDRNVYTMV